MTGASLAPTFPSSAATIESVDDAEAATGALGRTSDGSDSHGAAESRAAEVAAPAPASTGAEQLQEEQDAGGDDDDDLPGLYPPASTSASASVAAAPAPASAPAQPSHLHSYEVPTPSTSLPPLPADAAIDALASSDGEAEDHLSAAGAAGRSDRPLAHRRSSGTAEAEERYRPSKYDLDGDDGTQPHHTPDACQATYVLSCVAGVPVDEAVALRRTVAAAVQRAVAKEEVRYLVHYGC